MFKKYLKLFWKTKGKLQLHLLESDLLVLTDNSNIIKNGITTCLAAIFIGVLGILGIILFPIILLFLLIDKIVAFSKEFEDFKRKEEIKKKKKESISKGIQNYEKCILNDHAGLLLGTHNRYPANITIFKDLETFIFNFLNVLNVKYCTLHKETLEMTCERGKRRSLEDIFLICKYYYPNCTMEEVLIVLIDILENKDIYIGASYCNTINKYVFHIQSDVYNKTDQVEYFRKESYPLCNMKFKDLIEVYLDK